MNLTSFEILSRKISVDLTELTFINFVILTSKKLIVVLNIFLYVRRNVTKKFLIG